jgi:chromate reductase, NAD(P)H dehydrogenase (quinone)
MKMIGISGALRKASTNTGLLRALKDVAPENVSVEVVTLHGIPLYDGDVEAASGKPKAVLELDAKIRGSEGIVIATPEYNSTIPGVLKNATDWLSRGGSPFRWRKVGVIGAADGQLGTGRSQLQLRQNMQALEAIVMPKPEFLAGNNSQKFDADGNLHDEDCRRRLAKWLESYIAFLRAKI